MKAGPFISLIAETFGLDPKAVAFADRVMREAGYITTGARGVNAPHRTVRDAARLALALMTGEGPNKIVEEFEFYRALTLSHQSLNECGGLFSICDLPDDHSLEDLLTWFFALWEHPEQLEPFNIKIMDKTYAPVFFVRLNESTRNVTIVLANGAEKIELLYADVAAQQRLQELHQMYLAAIKSSDFELAERVSAEQVAISKRSMLGGKGMRVTREISTPEIAAIGRAIAGGAD